MIDYLRMLKQGNDYNRRGIVSMEIEFFPEVTRLLENNVNPLNIHGLHRVLVLDPHIIGIQFMNLIIH